MEDLRQQLKHHFYLEEETPNIYINRKPWRLQGGGGLFGGQMLAQSLAAAVLSLEDDFAPHSLHSYFLIAGRLDVPLCFHVDRIRDGRSFATRTVNIKQSGQTIFILTASFQKIPKGDNQISHQYSMPDVYPVDSGETLGNSPLKHGNMRLGTWALDFKVFEECTPRIESRLAVPKDPILRKNFDLGVTSYLEKIEKSEKKLDSTQIRLPYNYRWMRIDDVLNVHPTVHSCMLTGLSDVLYMWTAGMPHLWGYNFNKNAPAMSVSLDHAIHFHAPVKADSWLLWVVESPRFSNERGYILGRFYDQNGVLVASVVQETLFRIKPLLPSAANDFSFSVSHPVLDQSDKTEKIQTLGHTTKNSKL